MQFTDVLSWILPPVLGAIIGYVTNAIAIKMLFRPYREWRLFGMKIPFTPGIIPKQRHQLAESIGRMVSKELLTADMILSQTASPDFQKNIRENISSLTSDFFSQSTQRIVTSINNPNQSQSGFLIKDVIQGFFMSESFTHAVDMITTSGLNDLTEHRVGDVLQNRDNRERFVAKTLSLITGEGAEDRAINLVDSWLRERLEKNTRIGELLSAGTVKRIREALSVLYGPLLGFATRWLRREGIRDKLEEHGKSLLRDILDKLNVFQKLLIAATQYDRTLEENMKGIVEDVIDEIETVGVQDETKKELIESIGKELRALRKTGFADMQRDMEISFQEKSHAAIQGIFKFLRKESTKSKINSALQNFFDRYQDKSLAELLETVLSKDNAAAYLSELIRENIVISERRIAERVMTFLSDLLKDHMDKSLQELIGISDETQARIDEMLAEMAVRVINKRVPDVLESFDIYNLVVSKIDGLRVEDVEGLLMRVIHRHLKWINAFGAMLGFLIGMTQILTRIII